MILENNQKPINESILRFYINNIEKTMEYIFLCINKVYGKEFRKCYTSNR